MPWMETSPVEQRERFIRDHRLNLYAMVELYARYGISRKTGYKWLTRFDEGGRRGLRDRSRAPHHCPHRISHELAAVICAARRQHPSWGPAKLLAWLQPRHPGIEWPAISTAGDLLARRGLVQKRRRRRQYQHPGVVPAITTQPNDLWTAGSPISPHATCSRATGCCPPRGAASVPSSTGCFASTVCRERPHRQRCALRHHRHSRPLPAECLVAAPGHSAPAHSPRPPGTERRPRADAQDAQERGLPPAAHHPRHAAARLHAFRRLYNDERPRAALADRPPAALYRPSPRLYTDALPPLEYPGHFLVKRVTNAGTIRLKKRLLFVSNALQQHPIGLEEIDGGIWPIHFCHVLLGRVDERDYVIRA